MLSFLFLRYLSDNYETAAKKELGKDYPRETEVAAEIEKASANKAKEAAAKKAKRKKNEADTDEEEEEPLPIVTPLQLWYSRNAEDVADFEKQMRRKVHYVLQPQHLWNSIAYMARTQKGKLLDTLQAGFKYIETESFQSTFQGLFSEIDLSSPKLGKKFLPPVPARSRASSTPHSRFPTSSPPSSRWTATNRRPEPRSGWTV